MNRYLAKDIKPNYDKYPEVEVPGYEEACVAGWPAVMSALSEAVRAKQTGLLVLECYQGVHDAEVLKALGEAFPGAALYLSADAM